MSVRPAAYPDLLPAAKVLADAFKDEALFGGHFHPYRHDFPDDMHLFFLRKLRLDWARTGSSEIHVLVSHPPEDATKITGVAIWTRKRAAPKKDDAAVVAQVKAMEAANAAESALYPNRAAEPKNHGILGEAEPFMKHHWSGSRAESWYLDVLGVDPAQGGHGYGKVLVKFGLDLARAEGMGASVISAKDRESYYTALGFDVTVGTVRDFGGEANPFVGREYLGGTIHFWDGGKEVTGLKGYGEV